MAGDEIDAYGVSLLALRATSTENPKQAFSTWVDSNSTPCKWAGIYDEIHHKVTSIELSSKNLTGYIPSEIGLCHTGSPLCKTSLTLTCLQTVSMIHSLRAKQLNPFGRDSKSFIQSVFRRDSGDFGLFPVMLSLDLRHNNLTGKIPEVGSILSQVSFSVG
ncbi:Leucine-rich repeat protein kinase family protein [Forsythia ovata]|uniref:Leucine-rich repeat protein kinase family protein n=1 Tax=Forsythia ovata TaxID=205694 RepID=A0ABD1WFT9_9LAMI